MKKLFTHSLVAAGAILISGCGSPDSKHTIRPPDPPSTNKIPRTRDEKIAAIMKAPISEDMKKAAIAKVKAGPGP
jgi:PBP1b-binding outer membrane lipoprotein LpoB